MILAADVGGTKTLAERLGDCPVQLLNDLEAMAYGVPGLDPEEQAVLQDGIAVPGGNAALIAAGTGLGEALLQPTSAARRTTTGSSRSS